MSSSEMNTQVAQLELQPMSDDKQKILNEILKNTAQTAERTRNIERELASFQQRYESESNIKQKRLSDLERKTNRNSLVISAITAFLTITYSAFAVWVFGII